METRALEDVFAEAGSLPHGAARVAALELVQQRADAEAGDTDLPFRVRLDLTWSYQQGAEKVRSLVPFAWCVAEFDRDPERYAALEHNLLWAFKWVPGTLVDDPSIPLDHTLRLLDDMERRYRAGGHSMHAVHAVRHIVADHIGDTEAAEREFRAWLLAPRDGLSDCSGCDPSGKVTYLASVGRHDEAVVTGGPVLQGALTCAEQPETILAGLLESFVRTGRIDEAADAHTRGYRLSRPHRSRLDLIARHIRFLACTDNVARALELVERHLPWLDEVWNPWSEMRFAAASALALSRVDSTLPVRTPSGVLGAAELGAQLIGRARNLAARFDQRNGSAAQSDRIERLVSEEGWGSVALSARARRVRELQEQPHATAPVNPLPAVETELPSPHLDVGELLGHFEGRWKEADDTGALAALDLLESTFPEDQLDAGQRGRLHVARGLRAWRDDLDQALGYFEEALPHLDAAGDELRVRQVRGRIGGVMAMQGRYDEARAIGEGPLRWLADNEQDSRSRSRWRVRLGEILLPFDPAEAEAVLRQARLEMDPRDAGHAELMHGDALASLDRVEEAEQAFNAAIAAALRVDRRAAALPLMRRGVVRCQLGKPGEGAEDLAEAAALLSAEGADPAPVLVELAAAFLQAGNADQAIQAGEEALPWIAEHDDVHRHIHLRSVLAAASEEFGERDAEVDHLREARSITSAWQPEDDEGAAWQRQQLAAFADREAQALSALERDEEAIGAFVMAADGWEALGYPEGAARSLRGAARSAHWSGRAGDAVQLRERAERLLSGVDGEEAGFHRAGLAWDRSSAAADSGEMAEGIRYAMEAEALYREIGFGPAVDDAVLRQARLGAPVEPRVIQEIFQRAEEQSETWYVAGYLVVDHLEAGGHRRRAAKIRKKLEA